jgi:tripartite-type tricarboxylate transporter receptor subunit TctC
MHKVGRRSFLAGAAALAGGTLGGSLDSAFAQGTWPTRPVRFIVPLAPGGGLDFIARIGSDIASRGLGQQVVVENRTGAGGTIGIEAVVKSPPDGYTVLIINDNVVSAPYVMQLPGEYLKDLMPVVMLGIQPQVFAVHPSLGVNSMEELIKFAKANPGQGCATSGIGTNQHVLLGWFMQETGVNFTHVPYRGAGQAIGDFIAGHVKVACLGPTAVLPQAAGGKVKVVAQSGAKRSPAMPDIPTLVELGVKDVVIESWYAAFVPTGTPAEAIKRLNEELGKAMADKDARERLLKTATEPVGGTPEQLAKQAREDADKYAKLVKALNITVKQ